MISAGIKELKNNLSRLLVRVKAGEEILITDRGRPIARIFGNPGAERDDHAAKPEYNKRSYLCCRNFGKTCFRNCDRGSKVIV